MRTGVRDTAATPGQWRDALARCALAALGLSIADAALAEDMDMLSGGVLDLDAITVTASPGGEPAYGALSPTTIWTRGALEPLQADTVTEVLTLIPSVNTQTTPADAGTAVSVRGLQDFGRVNVLVDGARQNFQKSGHGANGTFFFDTEMLRAVDVTRGPTSGVNGGGAIGGVVNFSTLDADDVLQGGETVAASLKAKAESNPESILLHGEAAARLSDRADVAVAGTWRDAGNYETGNGEEVIAAQDMLSGLAKARFTPDDDQEITLSALHYDSGFDSAFSEALTSRARSDTFTLGYHWDPTASWADLTAKVYYTTTQQERKADDGRTRFEIGTLGGDIHNTSRFVIGSMAHELTYGGDIFHDAVETRDPHGTSDDLTPSGDRLVYGAFVEDRIAVTERVELVGALRYDGYDLTGDDIANSGGRLSPKITLGYMPFTPVTVYATYAEAYRPPSLTETLIDGFHPPPVTTGRFLPNPDLKPEVARNIEAGVDFAFDGVVTPSDSLNVKLGVFHNRVEDYIEQVFEYFPIPGGYQYQNIAEATIQGFEFEARYDAERAFAGLSGQVMSGVDSRTGDQLTSVPPNRLTAIAGIRALDGDLEAGTRITFVGAKRDAEMLGLVGDPYQTVDLFATWKVNPRTDASLYFANIFNEQYTQYPNGSPSPGLNAKVSLTTRFGS